MDGVHKKTISKNIWTQTVFCGIVMSTTIGEQMITREQAISIAEDYFNGDFKANYCEHRFEYSESEKRWYELCIYMSQTGAILTRAIRRCIFHTSFTLTSRENSPK